MAGNTFSFEEASAAPASGSTFSFEDTQPKKAVGAMSYIGQQAKAGLTADLPTIAGKALQYAGATDVGTKLRQYGEDNAQAAQPEEDRGAVTKMVAGALRGAAPIVPLAVGGLAANVVAPEVAVPLELGGAAALAGGFGGAQAQDTYEKAKAAGLPDDQATSVARKTGLITGVGMGAVGALTGGVAAPAVRAIAGPVAKTAAEGLANVAAPSVVRPLLADTAGHLVGNVASMAAANAGTAAVEQQAGLPGPTPGQAALEGVESGASLTAALLPFGMARTALAKRANTATIDRLQSASTDPEQRTQIAAQIHANLKAVDPAAADQFAQNVQQSIDLGQPVTLGEHLLKPFESKATPAAPPPEIPVPNFDTAPGAAAPKDGVDYQRQVDTSGLSLVDPQEQARAQAASIDFAPADQTPSLTTSPGAAGEPRTGLPMPAPEIDTSGLSLKPSEAMGLDPAAGPISRAAVLAVDSGAHQHVTEQAAQAAAAEAAAKAPKGKNAQAAEPTSEPAPGTPDAGAVAAGQAGGSDAAGMGMGVPADQTIQPNPALNVIAQGRAEQANKFPAGKPSVAEENVTTHTAALSENELDAVHSLSDLLPERNALSDVPLRSAMRQIGFTEPEIKDATAAQALRGPQADGAGDGGAVPPAKGAPQAGAGSGNEAARAAETSKPAKGLSLGITPGNADPITVKDGIVHIGKDPAIGFDSGEPVTVKAGASDAEIKQALKDAGAVSRRQKFYGGQEASTTQAPVAHEPSAAASSAPTNVPAVKQQLFVQRGKQRFAVSSLQEASDKWGQFREAVTQQGSGGVGDIGSSTRIVDQDGKEVARISYNGKVWPPGEWHSGMKPLVGENYAPKNTESKRAEVPKPKEPEASTAKGSGPTQGDTGAAATKAGAGAVEAAGLKERPANWRSNFMQATQVGKSVGIPYVQGRKLADLLAMIDAKDGEGSATSGTAEGLAKLLGKAVKREAMESQGRNVLDDMAEANESPRDVADKFWRDTYFKLPAEAQARFKKMAQNHSGEDVLTSKDSPADVFDLPSSVEQLEGTERGFVVLMKEGNARFAEAAPEPAKAPAANESTHKEQGKPAEPASAPVVAESLKKAANAEDRTPAQMKADLLGQIDAAMETAHDDSDERAAIFKMYPARAPTSDEARKYLVAEMNGRGNLTDAKERLTKLWTRGINDALAALSERTGFVTFDVPGDGKFKVVNTKDRLAEFRSNVEKSPGFKAEPKRSTAPTSAASPGTVSALQNMVEENDYQAALDYATAKGVSLDYLKLSKPDRAKLDEWLKTNPKPTGEEATASKPTATAPEQPAAAAKPKVEGKEAPQAVKGPEGGKGLDHGELSIPNRTSTINAELDRYKADQAKQERERQKGNVIQLRADKAKAKELFAQLWPAMKDKMGARFGAKELRDTLDSMVKWQPAKFIALAEKFHSENPSGAPMFSRRDFNATTTGDRALMRALRNAKTIGEALKISAGMPHATETEKALIADLLQRPDVATGSFTVGKDSLIDKFMVKGSFFNDARRINLNEIGDIPTLIHEATHAATMYSLAEHFEEDENGRVQPTTELGSDLQGLFDTAKAKAPLAFTHYGLTDPIEFLAEAESNGRFKALLKTIDVDDAKPKTVWQAVKEWVARLLGVKAQGRNALDAALEFSTKFKDGNLQALLKQIDSGEVDFARGDSQPRGLTREQFQSAVSEAFGPKVAARLEQSGVVVPLADQSQLPAHVVPFVRDGDKIYGFHDSKTNKTYAVLSNLTPDMVKGLTLHEVGVHYGFDAMLGREKYTQVIARLKFMGKAGNEEVRSALADAKRNSSAPNQVPEETLAYLVTHHPEMGFVREVVASIKAFLFKNFGIGGKYLTADDMTALAKAAVLHASRTEPGARAPDFAKPTTSFARTIDAAAATIDKIKDSEAAKHIDTAWDGVKMATAPQYRSPAAQEMARTIIAGMGEKEMRGIRFRSDLNKAIGDNTKANTLGAKARDLIEKGLTVQADKVFLRQSPEENRAFMQAMDTGDAKYFDAHPDLKQMASVIGQMFDEKALEIQSLDTGALQQVRENYFPHIWNREPSGDKQREIFSTLAKRPLEGRKGFTKQRVFEDVQAGIDAGFEPVSNNPLDLVMLKMEEMDKYILAHKTLSTMEGTNGVHLIAAGEKTPQGFVDVNGRFGGIERNGEKLRYVAREDVGQVINNYLSPSLYHNKYVGKPFTAYMGAANTLNQFQLGVFSAFHAGFTSFEAVISHASIGIKALTAGDFKGAAKYLGSAPAAWINNPRMGSKIIEAMTGTAAHPELAPILEGLQLAGFKWQMDNRFRTDATKNMLQAWQEGKKVKAGINSIPAMVEQTARPILEWLVPRQKFGVFGEMYSKWMQDHPQATHEELRDSAQQIWNRVDSRLGQVVYDRLFVHNVAKNFAQMLIRAPGWTGGTILEVGGGVKDLAGYAKDLAMGKRPQGISDRAAYTLSMLLVTATANALLTSLFTGSAPTDWKDLVAFRTGNVDEHGRPERFMLPTYMKDVYAWTKAPGTTALNKAHPLLSLVGDIGRNRDFYGTEIRNEDDSVLQQLAQSAGFAAKAFVPFWVKGVQKEQEREGSAAATAAPLFGVMPAPSDLNKSDAEKLMSKYAADKVPQGSRTQEETDKANLRRQMYLALRKGEQDKAKELFDQGRKDGLFGPRDYLKAMRDARQDPLLHNFSHLTYEQAQRVMKVASEDEKRELAPAFMRKRVAWQRQHQGVQTAAE